MSTSTCMPRSKARNSASVSAARGVTMRSIGGSSARFKNSAVRPSSPDDAKRSRKYAAVSWAMPSATKTTATSSASSAPPSARLQRDLRGELVVREAGAGEDRELLAADQGVEPVDGRDAGLDDVARVVARGRVERRAVDVEARLGHRRRQPVARPTEAVEHAPEHLARDAQVQRLAAEAHAARRRGAARWCRPTARRWSRRCPRRAPRRGGGPRTSGPRRPRRRRPGRSPRGRAAVRRRGPRGRRRS